MSWGQSAVRRPLYPYKIVHVFIYWQKKSNMREMVEWSGLYVEKGNSHPGHSTKKSKRKKKMKFARTIMFYFFNYLVVYYYYFLSSSLLCTSVQYLPTLTVSKAHSVCHICRGIPFALLYTMSPCWTGALNSLKAQYSAADSSYRLYQPNDPNGPKSS